jgi:hypothetical protein
MKVKEKQIEIAKKIVEQGGGCSGFACDKYCSEQDQPVCGLYYFCHGWSHQAIDAAQANLKKHSKIRKKDLLERVEKLEEKVDGFEPHRRNDVADEKEQLKLKILSLIRQYEDRTGGEVLKLALDNDKSHNTTRRTHGGGYLVTIDRSKRDIRLVIYQERQDK